MTPTLSIVIPTRNRPQILRRCLDNIARQTIIDQLEAIVVIDGEDSQTAEMLSSLRWSFPLTCFAIPKSQQGVARNRGVAHARGEIVLFIGDDIFLAPDACERHMEIHRRVMLSPSKHEHDNAMSTLRRVQGDTAVLGFTTWDPAVGITAAMHWLERTGWQFGYAHIAEYVGKFLPSDLQHRFTYTSNISLPKQIAFQIPLQEDVTLYGWEDIEWGIRLRDAGIRLFFEPTAGSLHHHHLTLEDSLKRMEALGVSARNFTSLQPGFDRIPRGWKWAAYHLIALIPTMRGKHARAFLRGINRDP